MQLDRKKLLLGLIVVLAIVGFVLYLLRDDTSQDQSSAPAQQTEQQLVSEEEETEEPLNPNEELEQENEAEVSNPRPGEGEPNKTPVVVSEKPVIYTGYGHNSKKPLLSGQTTSTSCTTDANVECQITLTNAETDEIIVFEAKTTDQEGVALWQWTGGDQVGPGEWNLVATAGDKSSETEVIYVQ